MAPSLEELRARPDDREQLLVYADWLESQGDPRGELIAVQDAEQHCTSAAEFEAARARAIELIEGHDTLLPDTSGLDQASARSWAVWRGGFIRRLEIFVFDHKPMPDVPRSRWDRFIVTLLEHPSFALLDELLIRFNMPEDHGFVGWTIQKCAMQWQSARQSAPPPLVALWTSWVPRWPGRERVCKALPGVRTLWYSTDLTRVPPPGDSPTMGLERALIEGGPAGRFEFAWFDSRGHFREVFEKPAFAVHVRHMAEHREATRLACHDSLPQRRIAALFDTLAARFDAPAHTRALAPRRLQRPESIDLATACARLGDNGSLAPALARFGDVEWWSVEQRCEGERWTAVLGLGPEQLLGLARLV
jgi:uncharacterized protein (TIGR02996 family)